MRFWLARSTGGRRVLRLNVCRPTARAAGSDPRGPGRGATGYEPPMSTNASTPLAPTSLALAPTVQEDAADLSALIPWLPGPPLQPRPGLTDQDLERITRAIHAARAPGTHKIYEYAWGSGPRGVRSAGSNRSRPTRLRCAPS
jgi:hypothetical protein